QRYVAAEDRSGNTPQQMRQRADMIFMCVSENYTFDSQAVLLERGKFRDENPATELRMLREHHAAIDNYRAAAALDSHQIEPYFAQSSECKNSDWSVYAPTLRHRHCHYTKLNYIARRIDPKASCPLLRQPCESVFSGQLAYVWGRE